MVTFNGHVLDQSVDVPEHLLWLLLSAQEFWKGPSLDFAFLEVILAQPESY